MNIATVKRKLKSKNLEDHVELFCKLDNDYIPRVTYETKKEIVVYLEKYLHQVREKKSGAGFLLGDLLGDHYDLSLSLPVLKRQAVNAKYKEGRSYALYGIYMAYLKTKDIELKKFIISCGKNDKSIYVKHYAKWILDRIRDASH